MAGDDVDALVGRLLVASASLTGIDQSPVKITCVVIDGSTERAPRAKLLTLISTCGIGLAATKPSFLVLVAWAAAMPFRYWHIADIAEIAADVVRLAFVPQPAAMAELDVRIFLRHLEHVRVEIAEAGREQQRRAVQLDHALHGLLHVVGLRDLLFLDDLDPGIFFSTAAPSACAWL